MARITDYEPAEQVWTVLLPPAVTRPAAVPARFAGVHDGKPIVVVPGEALAELLDGVPAARKAAAVRTYWRLVWKAEADARAEVAAGLPCLKR